MPLSDEQKLNFLLKILKEYAERNHCYNDNPYYEYPEPRWQVFEDGTDYGEILFARTLLEQMGVEFKNPTMREDNGL